MPSLKSSDGEARMKADLKKEVKAAKKQIQSGLQGAFKICVSGAAAGETVTQSAGKAYEIGRQIALSGAILVTGATTGLPFEAARGNYENGGLTIGFSPAATPIAHLKSYKLPTDFHDVIVYTGFDYSGRNLILTRAADAVISVGGRMGTLNEFTIAFEDKKTIGILLNSGGIVDEIPHLLHSAKKEIKSHVLYDTDPKALVEKVIADLIATNKKIRERYGI